VSEKAKERKRKIREKEKNHVSRQPKPSINNHKQRKRRSEKNGEKTLFTS
jgi:hypothetical protein